MKNICINISKEIGTPKYKQIIDSILDAIEKGILKKGDRIPSLNMVMKKNNLSRDTVVTAFNELKNRGIISSTPGKGYYILSTDIKRKLSIFVLFDELNAFKETLYNSFIEEIQPFALVDIQFHYFNKKIFNRLIQENADKYNSFIIMPVDFQGIKDSLSLLKKSNVYILDQLNSEAQEHPAIHQDFSQDMYNALLSGVGKLRKYQKLHLVYPGGKEPIGQKEGFESFCKDNSFEHTVIQSLKNHSINKYEVYIMPNDNDLVEIVKYCKNHKLKIGEEIGIISYNDSPLKEVVADGITTISTDFRQMGKTLASMVLNKSKEKILNSSSLILRNSL